MRNLFLLFAKNGGVILFLFLEFFCLYLVVNYNQKQNQIFFSSANLVMGTIYGGFDGVAKYVDISENADKLATENAKLKAKLRDAKFLETIIGDTINNKDLQQHFSYISASVINNSIDRHNNSITLNRGSAHGVKPRMGVIGIENKGIIGIVKNTSNNFSQVMSVLHRQSKINVALKKSGYFGPMVWDGKDPLYTYLEDIPKHAVLEKGQFVETSGYSHQFPKGIIVGTVDTFWRNNGSNFWTIKLKLYNDLSKVQYGYVVNNIMKEELETIEEEVKNE